MHLSRRGAIKRLGPIEGTMRGSYNVARPPARIRERGRIEGGNDERMAREYRVISADSHLDLAPDRWTPRVPAPWRERAPRVVKLPNGADGVAYENRPLHRLQYARMGGTPTSEKHKLAPTYEE